MNSIQDTSNLDTESATTEKKSGRGRKAKASAGDQSGTSVSFAKNAFDVSDEPTPRGASAILNATTHGKFVLFSIPRAEQVEKGPVMRGFVEVKTQEGIAPVKVNVAAWLKIGRASGVEYLSLKVGNNTVEDPEAYSVGPFYGRLFRQVEGTRTRYFGFIEDAEKTGEDENGQGLYERHWQIRVTAKPALSNDHKTRYIAGQVMPSQQSEEAADEDQLPF